MIRREVERGGRRCPRRPEPLPRLQAVTDHSRHRPADWQERLRAKGYRLTRSASWSCGRSSGSATPPRRGVRRSPGGVERGEHLHRLRSWRSSGSQLVWHAHLTDRAPTYHSSTRRRTSTWLPRLREGQRGRPGHHRPDDRGAAGALRLRHRRRPPDGLRHLRGVVRRQARDSPDVRARRAESPYDATPVQLAHPDIDAGSAASWRCRGCYHADHELREGRHFVEALSDAGYPASRSLLSRWKSARFRSPTRAWRPTSGRSAWRPAGHPRLPVTSGKLRGRAGEGESVPARPRPRALHRTARQAVRPRRGRRRPAGLAKALGWYSSVAPMVHLRPRPDRGRRRLVDELPQSVKVAYQQYSTTAMNITSSSTLKLFMTDTIDPLFLRPQRTVHDKPTMQILTTSYRPARPPRCCST